jgi:hypothetical protein
MHTKKIVPTALLLVFSAFLLTHNPSPAITSELSYDSMFKEKSATGGGLAHAFFYLLSATGSSYGTVGTTAEQDEASRALIKPYLDPAFQLQRASGERYVAATYLPADVDAFEIGDVRETRPTDDLLVVRYSVRTKETLPDAAVVMSKDKAPRLTVFHWNASDESWKILSHANFNTPLAAVCDKDPLVDNGLESSASADDQKLGVDLAEKWLTLLQMGNSRMMLNPEAQGQGAGGVGFTTIEEYNEPKIEKLQSDDFVVTRNGSLIVVSLYAQAVYELSQESGVVSNVTTPSLPLTEEVTPRLFTFLQSEDKSWSLIATAIFNPPRELPAGTQCVPAGKLEDAPL